MSRFFGEQILPRQFYKRGQNFYTKPVSPHQNPHPPSPHSFFSRDKFLDFLLIKMQYFILLDGHFTSTKFLLIGRVSARAQFSERES